MPIMAAQDQNDVRGSTRILASTAKRYLESIPEDNRHIPAMNGLFRLLKVYRASGFRGYEYQPRIDRGPEAVNMLPATSRHVGDLRDALAYALSKVAAGQPPEVTIEAIQNVLRNVAMHSDVDEDGRLRTGQFLDSLLERLNTTA